MRFFLVGVAMRAIRNLRVDLFRDISRQRHALMHGLQVRRHRVCVLPHHFKARMPEHLLKVKEAPAPAQILRAEGVARGMDLFAWAD